MLAPELEVERWLNTDDPPTLRSLRGRVVLMVAFQTHCTGCVMYAIPQLQRMSEALDPREVAVLGLHAAFENQDAATPQALEAFVAQHRLSCPIAEDRPSDARIPCTMRAYRMQGTPTVVLVDRGGHLRMAHFGILDDETLIAHIARLMGERTT